MRHTIFVPVEVSDETYAQLLAGRRSTVRGAVMPFESSNASAARQFVESLTDSCQQTVMSIAMASRTPGNPISRTTVAQQTGLSIDQLSGVFGTIGRHWASTFGTQNPFAGRRIAPSNEVFYAIDPDLAAQLITEIEAAAQRWRTNVVGQRARTNAQPGA